MQGHIDRDKHGADYLRHAGGLDADAIGTSAGVRWPTALHQEIPEDKLSRVSAYDWFGSVSLMPLGTALAGPAEEAVGRTAALWGCAGLVVLVTALVLLVPDVRGLTRRTHPVAGSPAPSADAERPVGGLG